MQLERIKNLGTNKKAQRSISALKRCNLSLSPKDVLESPSQRSISASQRCNMSWGPATKAWTTGAPQFECIEEMQLI